MSDFMKALAIGLGTALFVATIGIIGVVYSLIIALLAVAAIPFIPLFMLASWLWIEIESRLRVRRWLKNLDTQ